MNLIIDIGNTRTKIAVFENGKINTYSAFETFTPNDLIKISSDQEIRYCIISSVNDIDRSIISFLSAKYSLFILDAKTPLPLKNHYETPETLGKDRLAAAVAAGNLFPGSDVLVIDAGTAITYDLILGGKIYMGGGISPGLDMRFKALNAFTGKLPLVGDISPAPLTGSNTIDSIRSGVINGTVCEIEGIISLYQQKYPSLEVILTGGNHYFFDKQLKIKTFAAPNLVLVGLNIILEYNIAKINLP
jgi:type III pantothenate kinase